MEKLTAILNRSLGRFPFQHRLAEYSVWTIWDDTVGAAVARNAQPEKIRNGTLIVKVSAPTWMQQLQYMKELITVKINERLGRQVVKGIFFVVGTLPHRPGAPEAPASGSPVDPARIPEAELLVLKDPELQVRLRRLFTAHLQRRRDAG